MRKYLQLVLLWAVVLVLAGSAGAEYYNEGHSGTAADPYVIDTNADLVMLRDRVNAGTESADKYYQLTQNLTISQYTNWKFIGTDTNPFTGHFDGNNLAIHVNITRGPYWSSEEDLQAGLFGTVSTNEGYAVKNLDVSGTITGMYTGGIVRRLNSGIVENCSFSGTIEDFQVSGNAYLGGIAGYMAGGTIRDCSFSGEITSTSYTDTTETGCIAAHMTGGSIENCTATGNVSVSSRETSTYAGGIVGYAQVASFEAIKDCIFSGNVKCSRYAGGIAGYISGGSLQNNSITGNANGQAVITGNYASGGIAGRIGDSTVLESCDVSSIVIVSGDTESEGIGGIVGIMNASIVRNNQSYASIGGDVPNMGGVVGKLDAASYTITNNRYSSAEHGIGNNAQGVPSEEGCIKVGASIAITTGSLPNAAANSSYTAVLTTNSTSSVVWTLTNSTSLPTGLTLDRTTGTISGTPKTAGTYTFTIKASPVSGAPATKEFTLTVQAEGSAPSTPAPTTSILITTTSLPSGLVGTPYSETLKASASGVTWSVYAGSLPNGLTLVNSSGRISGTPTSSGTFDFTIQARSTYASTTKSFRITIYQGSSSNNSSSGSSSGGGCTSGFGILGLILLAGMAFKKSQMKRSLYIVILLMFFSLPAHALIGKPDYVDPNKVNPYDFYVICKKGFAQKISEAVAKGADVNAIKSL